MDGIHFLRQVFMDLPCVDIMYDGGVFRMGGIFPLVGQWTSLPYGGHEGLKYLASLDTPVPFFTEGWTQFLIKIK